MERKSVENQTEHQVCREEGLASRSGGGWRNHVQLPAGTLHRPGRAGREGSPDCGQDGHASCGGCPLQRQQPCPQLRGQAGKRREEASTTEGQGGGAQLGEAVGGWLADGRFQERVER